MKVAVDQTGSAQDAWLRGLRYALVPSRTHSFSGKVSARVPYSHTQIATSYVWLENGYVTVVDPYGQAALQLQPFLNVQVRQPLPSVAFIPARVEALVDIRNLLAQGYTPVAAPGGEQLLLTPAYRSIRGGLSVSF